MEKTNLSPGTIIFLHKSVYKLCFFLAVSLPPSQPDVTDYNERSMTLRWRAPIDDGGMKITAYNIEAKTAGERGGGSAVRFVWTRGSSLSGVV